LTTESFCFNYSLAVSRTTEENDRKFELGLSAVLATVRWVDLVALVRAASISLLIDSRFQLRPQATLAK